jgi:hypothetical protein
VDRSILAAVSWTSSLGAGVVAVGVDSPVAAFIERWKKSEAAEQANSQLFLRELCDLLELPAPDPTVQDDAHNNYVFESSWTRIARRGRRFIRRSP